jgi:ATP-dependent exoDNAse (exonuclease V) beta subunit
MSNTEQFLIDDEQARAAALDTARSFIVQAPAGSGKTELLIQRYLRLLAVVAEPEEIMAITFTRKAAAEMQVRVLRALKGASLGETPAAEHEKITAQAAAAALEQDRACSWNLLENPKRMRIQTLDALNASIARAQPLTATGGASDTAIVADAEMRGLYREAAALTLDQLSESGQLQQATREVLVHVDTNAWLYIAYLARMLATRDQWLPFIGSGLLDTSDAAALRRQFESGLERAVEAHLELLNDAVRRVDWEELLELAHYAAANLRDNDDSNGPITRLNDSNGLPGRGVDAAGEWAALAELLLTRQGSYRKTANKNQGFPPGDNGEKNRFKDLLDELRDDEALRELLDGVRILPPVTYADDQWSVLLALFRLLPLAATELKRLFAERSVADHIEVALSAGAAIGTAESPGDVALLLDYQIRHVLIDEMQDTSSAQYRMIEALTGGWTEGDGRTLYCVGDPMQSIYRFRNAEVGQFLLSRDAGIGSIRLEPLTLRRNFRSGQHLVDWFNQVFPGVFAGRNDAERSAVAYEPAVSVPALEGLGECVVYPVFGANTVEEADIGLEVIRKLLAQDSKEEVAVLVRGRSHLPELLYRLRSAGIPYRAIEIDRLTDLPEIIDALALTRALVHPGDRHAWLALLRAPWAGLNWADIQALVWNNRDSTVWELMADTNVLEKLSDHGRQAIEGLRSKLEPVLARGRAESLRARVEQTWVSLGGPAIISEQHAIDNVYHFFDVVENLEVAGDLPDVGELESVLDMEHVSSNVDARLQVMTMHRAKGLQFDHVLLFGLGRIPRPREQSVLSWFDLPDEHGRPLKVISPVGPRSELEKDPMHTYIGRVESIKDRNELARLLYVACTRARKSLHLVGHARTLKTGMGPDRRSLLHLLWPAVRADYELAYDPDTHASENDETDTWVQPALRRFESGWHPPEIPAAPVPQDKVREEAASAVEYYWVGTGARIAGTLVHRWIQVVTDGGRCIDEIDEATAVEMCSRWLQETGISNHAASPILERAMQAIRSMLSDDNGRWLLQGEGHAELALSGLFDGMPESIVIDRVRIDGDGLHWIVDYKTSSHEGGGLGAFLEAETDRYRAQLAKYAEIYRNYSGADVRCALYFPLLQQFVTIDN